MMKNRLMAVLLTMIFLAYEITGLAAYDSSHIDFSRELSQIENLMVKCESEGISTDYERVNYTVINMFSTYLASDINETTMSDEVNGYNIKKIRELCTETISNLQAYLNGEKEPLEVKKSDMSNITDIGNTIYSGEDVVFANGLDMFEECINEIPRLSNLGYNYTQIEV